MLESCDKPCVAVDPGLSLPEQVQRQWRYSAALGIIACAALMVSQPISGTCVASSQGTSLLTSDPGV